MPGLPLPHAQHYCQLKESLTKLKANLDQPGQANTQLMADLLAIQQFFQSEILALPTDGLPAGVEHRLRAYQTEIHKHLRLLSHDISFLKAARQPQTIQQRQAQVGDRLETLRGYCQTLLGLDANSEQTPG